MDLWPALEGFAKKRVAPEIWQNTPRAKRGAAKRADSLTLPSFMRSDRKLVVKDDGHLYLMPQQQTSQVSSAILRWATPSYADTPSA
jgi:hypothetical protein